MATARLDALSRAGASILPTGEEEIWRYSRIGDLDLGRFAPVLPSSGDGPKLRTAVPPAAEELHRHLEGAVRVLTVGGHLVGEQALSEALSTEGVGITKASHDPGAEELFAFLAAERAARASSSRPGKPEEPPDTFGLLSDAFSPDALVVRVPKGAVVSRVVVICHTIPTMSVPGPETAGSPAQPGRWPEGVPALAPAAFPRTVVALGDDSEATVVEMLVSKRGLGLVMPTVDLVVGEGARLSHLVVQQLGPETVQIGRLFATGGRDATLRSFQASLGGSYARSRVESVLTGRGGSAQLLAAYFGSGDQMHDFRTLQEHAAPRTTSDLVFKGAIADTSRSVYSGLIRMRRGARGANAFQTNRNLVLSDGAHAESVPNLDIEENDVKCSHASAVGPIDEEQRFYLESRGVPRQAAERLILLGFFGDLLDRVHSGVASHVAREVARRVALVAASATGEPRADRP